MPHRTPTLPRLPVLGWAAFGGATQASLPTLLDRDPQALRYTTSGRAAILLALEALGLGPGQQVLLPTYHCPTMVAPAVGLGATPRFYSIDGRGQPRLDWLQSQNLDAVRAILVPHFFGLPQPMQALRDWCDQRHIALIEDCAHALFGRSGERAIGTWGDLAISSLTKFLPVPEGGCLVVNRGPARTEFQRCGPLQQVKAVLDIAEEGARHGRLGGLNWWIQAPLDAQRRLRQRHHPMPATAAAPEPGPGAEVPDDPDMLVDPRLAHRAPAAACRWVAQWLPRQRIVERRRLRYQELSQRLAGLPGLRPLMPVLPDDCAPYVFPLWVDRPDPGYAELRRRQMPVFRWDRLWPGTPELEDDHGRLWSHHVIQLACHQDLTDADVDALVACVQGIFASPQAASPASPSLPSVQAALPVCG